MSSRITKLSERIQKIVGVNNSNVTPVDIYDSLGDIQRKIAQDLLCLEASSTITTDSDGVADEPAGFYRLKRIVFPDGVLQFPKEVGVVEFDDLQRLLFTNISTTVQFFKRWNGELTFFPNPAVQTWTIYYYKVPTTTISASVDPEIPTYADDALMYGALSKLLLYKNDAENIQKAQLYRTMYDAEMQRLTNVWRGSKTNSNEIVYHDN